jgi:1,4-alpha-glucan branching enzyme
MTEIAEQSSNTLLSGPGAGVSNDGTGTLDPSPESCCCVWTNTATIGVIELDPYLSPFKDVLKRRYTKAQDWVKKLADTEGGIEKFSRVSISWVLHPQSIFSY